MNTEENKVNENSIDLGSDPIGDDFDPFASEDDLGDDIVIDTAVTPQTDKSKAPPASSNPLEKAISTAENKEAETAQQSLMEKAPVFEYAGASENIEDTSKTFDELRIEKATDFPELDDGKRVSWTVEYGKITKTVADPKATSIGKIKSEIETSKEFIDALKKAKDKNPACKLKPKVTAQSKGTAAYKGVFTSLEDAESAGKVISIVPGRDGNVYEIRNTNIGKFITPTSDCDMLSDVRAGFIPALPRIPMDTVMQIVSFFRYYMRNGSNREALVNVYWDKQDRQFLIDAPEQIVTPVSVNSRTGDDYANDRYVHFMDIHSHNSMRAFFSAVDDSDEKATRLYTVIGNLHEYFPDIKTRISNGGKFLNINPLEVFELADVSFPMKWTENVKFRTQHDDLKSDTKELYYDFIDGSDDK